MRRAAVLFVVPMLAACGRQGSVMTVDGLAHDPQRLHALRHRCITLRAPMDGATCRLAQAAYARRFYLGLGGPDAYQTLDSLPPIPASFDADDGARP